MASNLGIIRALGSTQYIHANNMAVFLSVIPAKFIPTKVGTYPREAYPRVCGERGAGFLFLPKSVKTPVL